MSTVTYRCMIIVAGLLLFVPGLGMVHLFDWDEINFAEAAREMLVTGNWLQMQINFEPFYEKPPLFIWFQALCMQLFGINEFAARLPNALTGIATLWVVFEIGRKEVHRDFGFIWSMVYTGSILPHFYCKSGIIDPLFNVLIFLGIYAMYKGCKPTESLANFRKYMVYAGVALGLAILTKGPVAILLAAMVWNIFSIFNFQHLKNRILYLFACVGIAVCVAGSWFGLETFVHGSTFVKEFILYNIRLFSTPDAGHAQPWFYHIVVVLVGCFPASIFFIAGAMLYRSLRKQDYFDFLWLQLILFFVVLLVFSIVKTKIIHYSSLCYLPLTAWGAYFVYDVYSKQKSLPLWIKWTITIFATLLGIVPILLGNIRYLRHFVVPYINDTFAVAIINQSVAWWGWEWLVGLFFIVGVCGSVWKIKNAYIILIATLLCTIFLVQGTLYAFVPKVEKHVQGPLIEFLKAQQDKEVYIHTLGFKSYAHYFYSRRKPDYCTKNTLCNNEDGLLHGTIDKPVFFITKCDRAFYSSDTRTTMFQNLGSFIIYRRLPSDKKIN